MKLFKQLLKNHHCVFCGKWAWRTVEVAITIFCGEILNERICLSCLIPKGLQDKLDNIYKLYNPTMRNEDFMYDCYNRT